MPYSLSSFAQANTAPGKHTLILDKAFTLLAILYISKDGYVTKTKVGIKNMYRIHPELPIKTADGAVVGELLKLLGWKHGQSQKTKGWSCLSFGKWVSPKQQ